jgi:hypothetical protein
MKKVFGEVFNYKNLKDVKIWILITDINEKFFNII